jgi:hypothetical protein
VIVRDDAEVRTTKGRRGVCGLFVGGCLSDRSATSETIESIDVGGRRRPMAGLSSVGRWRGSDWRIPDCAKRAGNANALDPLENEYRPDRITPISPAHCSRHFSADLWAADLHAVSGAFPIASTLLVPACSTQQITGKFKSGHCDFQTRPLGVETGQYPTTYAILLVNLASGTLR